MRLYAAISHHGFGHLAQTAPVLNALAGAASDMEFIVRSALPESVVARRVSVPFSHIDAPADCNFVMRDALRVDLSASLAAYHAFHAAWSARVEAEAEALVHLGVGLVFSDVGYLPLAAAQRAGIPSVAMCSLNWADIFAHYLEEQPGAAPMLAAMRAAYAGADAFLRPEPAMPMRDLANAVAIPPIAVVRRSRRAELAARLHLKPTDKLVLVGLGGIPHRLPVASWPEMPGIVWLLPDEWQVEHPAMFGFAATGMVYADLLASVDALVTKPGYGSFVEATCAGVPVLTLPREDWPETPYLLEWLQTHGNALEIEEVRVLSGNLRDALETLWAMPVRAAVSADGAEVAARLILELGWGSGIQ
ncbi:MAG: hypothetical protein IPG66_16260 [Hydrogenophilales bacterium]|nr:hypothetical protein [Hydrogenophilales bacterium]